MSELTWSPIPMDICHRCPYTKDDPLYGNAVPVAVSGIENNREWVSVRYICPRCRSVWDCSFSPNMLNLNQFEDEYISGHEAGFVSQPMGDGLEAIHFPAGPSRLFKRRG